MWFESSGWSYETGATGGVGIAFVSLSGGAIYLVDPAGRQVTFHDGGLGAGFSGGFKLPKLGRVPQPRIRQTAVSAAGSLKSFTSGGLVFKSTRFGSRELTRSDIQGAVLFLELGAGVIGGGSVNVMLFGMNSLLLAAGLTSTAMSSLTTQAIEGASGLLVMGGLNVGIQAGWSAAGLVGYLH